MRKHNGIISVERRKSITSALSLLTRAPITPRLVKRKYSNGLVLLVVFKKGYKYKGMCACKNAPLVESCDAMHCNKASALQTLVETAELRLGGTNNG